MLSERMVRLEVVRAVVHACPTLANSPAGVLQQAEPLVDWVMRGADAPPLSAIVPRER